MRVLTETAPLISSAKDRFGNLRPTHLMVLMQEMGGRHSIFLGVGREELLKLGAVWVLIRSEIRIYRQPQVNDMIVATTFPGAPRRTLYPRYHRFHLEDGTLLAEGVGAWTLADVESRRMVSLPQVTALMPDTSDLEKPIGYPGSVEPVEGREIRMERALRYSDFDVNQHVNNTRCGDWVCDLLDEEVLSTHAITRFLANYRREIRPGGPVDLTAQVAGDRFSFACKRDGEVLLDCGGWLTPKES
ncbi:MAG: hypothetical protein GX650_06890 [Clostridiales bacterium]|nr:hypothetical protein [Clostridiales bacterium]